MKNLEKILETKKIMTTKHTTGKWRKMTCNDHNEIYISDNYGNEIARTPKRFGQSNGIDKINEIEANAKLMAAAPELLDALIEMSIALTGHEIEKDQETAFEKMRLAIEKATK